MVVWMEWDDWLVIQVTWTLAVIESPNDRLI
jgi:hypothetical protein